MRLSSLLWPVRLWWFRTFQLRSMPAPQPMALPAGYVYVPADETGPMAAAMPGALIRNPDRRAPWIVVEREIARLVPTGWPGRLWRVEVLDPADGADQPLRHASYLRAVAVRVMEEVPAAGMFGRRGAALCRILDAAAGLTLTQAEALAAARHPEAGATRERVWRAWLQGQSRSFPAPASLEDVLSVGAGEQSSPVNGGLRVLQGVLLRRAQAVAGEAALVIDGEDASLAAPWQEAGSALGDAMLGLGAAELTSADRLVLAAAWYRVFDPDLA